jgi:serine/threonine-protein kinase
MGRSETSSGGSRISGPHAEAAAESSIAVLPFRNMSLDREAEYFSDGVTEEIVNALTQLEGLHVAARSSTIGYKGKDVDVRAIGAELGVRSVLEGSVRQAGRRIRITAQLVDAATGYHIWSERYDRELEDIFAIQDEIARTIAEKLQCRLGASSDAPLIEALTSDVTAYDLYLKGRYDWNQRRLKAAIGRFEAAIARDPGFSAAHLGLADTYAVWGFYGGIPTWEAYGRARNAAETAQEIAPDAPGVSLSLGIIEHYYGWNTAREERLLKEAAERNPKSYEPHFWLSLSRLGPAEHFEEGLAAARKAVEVEPRSANAHTALAWPYARIRRWSEAVPHLRKALELDARAAFPLWTLGYVLHQMGEREEAVATLQRAVELTEREHLFELALLGAALAASGREGPARAILAELEDRARRSYVPPYDVAVLLASLGEREQALSALERAYDERNALLWFRLHLPYFDALRGEPRWQTIAARLARTAPAGGSGPSAG